VRGFHLKRKSLMIPCILTLLLFQIIQFTWAYHIPTPYISGTDFTIECSEGSSLAFQGDDSLQVEVLSGIWNSSSNYILTYNDGGQLTFVALNDTTLEVCSPDVEGGFNIQIIGANQTTHLGNLTYNMVVKSGDNVNILWNWRIESWIGKYTMFALGLSGLILMVASPSWVAYQLRKGGIKPEDFERTMYGLLLFCVGFGLLVMWLW